MHLHFTASLCPIVMPLSAAHAAAKPSRGVALLSQPVFFERELLHGAGLFAPVVPPQGTVTATAIDLAAASTRGPVIAAGVDLCTRDMMSHARPNLFDRLRWLSSGRLSPHYSQSFLSTARAPSESRSIAGTRIRFPLPLRTYAGWLSSHTPERPPAAQGIFRLLPSSVDLASMKGVGREWMLDLPPLKEVSPRLKADPALPAKARRTSIVHSSLEGWIRTVTKGLHEVKSRSDPTSIAATPALLDLCYYCGARALIEVRRKLRHGVKDAALETAVELLENTRSFLEFMREKTCV
jgi:hypothetical protein